MAVSDRVKSGPEKAPHRSLWKALGLTDEELKLPLIGVVSAKSECVPGHNHLNNIAQAVKDGIRLAGGVPVEFPAIGVCDGIAMGHVGMKYSLASRELIADSCESMAIAHGFDGMVFIPNCDKIVPGMLMAAPPQPARHGHLRRPDDARPHARRQRRHGFELRVRGGRRV